MNLQSLTSALPKPWLTINCESVDAEELKTNNGPVRSLVYVSAAGAVDLFGSTAGLQRCRDNNTLIPVQSGLPANFLRVGGLYQFKIAGFIKTALPQNFRVAYYGDPLVPASVIWTTRAILIDTLGVDQSFLINANVTVRTDGVAGTINWDVQSAAVGLAPVIIDLSGNAIDTTVAYPNAGFFMEWIDLTPANKLRATGVSLIA